MMDRLGIRTFRNAGVVWCLFLLSLPVLLGTVDRMTGMPAQVAADDWVNLRYQAHPVITALHLLPGFVMLILGPLQISEPLRRRSPGLHRWSGRVFVGAGAVSGLGVLWMVFAFPALGGALTQAVTCLLVTGMIASMTISVRAARRRRFRDHRAYMMRAYAVALSVSTARIFIEAADFAFDVPFEDSFVLASGLGVVVNLLVTEVALWRGANHAGPSAQPRQVTPNL
ncbi:DUF2306 domain-containing protein [Jannaschia sp. M317]|uniref:DUF2306 domain-containing protein n=1 Tax=Jannaschia sp. M317 TaxID=2867011 RepID=UPI0021A44C37|nr:DUF2306 domain-containing protein [Jannaschia sp. M317]UWQ18610.1 DUF2306 domain-containing protein [Jannaschia sp. M317]